VLSAPQTAGRTAPYIAEHDFDFVGLDREAETMSRGEQLLVQIAGDLWNAERAVGVRDLVRKLDQRHFERVIEAFRIARGTYALDPLGLPPTRRPSSRPSPPGRVVKGREDCRVLLPSVTHGAWR
jgi:hypothetical protein